MPPPKQKPIARQRLAPMRRLPSSVTAAFMSASKRVRRDLAASAAATSASPGNAPVPPSSESRSSASADQPLAAKRPATLRMCVGQAAVLVDDEHAAARLGRRRPRRHQRPVRAGERDRRRRHGRPVRRAPVAPWPCPPPCPWPWPPPRLRRGLGGQHRRRRRRADPEQPEPPHRLPPGDDPVGVVLGDLFREVLLELRHRALPLRDVDRLRRVPDESSRRTSARRRASARAAPASRAWRNSKNAAVSLRAARRRACRRRAPRRPRRARAPSGSAAPRGDDRLVPEVVVQPVDVAARARARARGRRG